VQKWNKYFKKEKSGQAYFVEWDYDASFDEDDDDRPSKGLVGLLSRKLLHSSPSHIVSWQKVNQR
jgi:hypothetical protein